ncbi:MAG: adenylate/guanylate cyclase domain-containing protein [Desertifilum sp.]|nr:adenylate/guanylate cyclase domain-containing protein [Desertifilum sp.]
MNKLPKFRNLLISRLSRQLALWIFASIISIEAIILVPSYARRERELLAKTESIAQILVESIIALKQQNISEEMLLQQIEQLKDKTAIVGIAIYGGNYRLVMVVGEPPTIAIADLPNQDVVRFREGDRYDIAWSAMVLNQPYTLVVRNDIRPVYRELYAFIGRIFILVLIISVFVTGVMMLVLAKAVIYPILSLRNDLIAAGESLDRENKMTQFYAVTSRHNNELDDVMAAFNQTFERVNREIQQRQQAEAVLRLEQEKSEKLLLNILPEMIAIQLKQGQNKIAKGFTEATILFADIVGFTPLSARYSPEVLVELLNDIFSEFDQLTEQHGLEKIKTIGDAYMVVGGIPNPRPDCAAAIANFALDMQVKIQQVSDRCGESLKLRIGINTGPVVAGVIGTKKFSYDLWGDAVNTASRMESQGIPGSIQVTETTYKRLCDRYSLVQRGSIPIKGKGMMTTYLLIGKKQTHDL